MMTRTLLTLSSAALLAACSNQNSPLTGAQDSNPYGVPQPDAYGTATPAPVTGDRNPAPYQPLPDVAETGTYAPDSGPAAPPAPPADDIYGGLSPAPAPAPKTSATSQATSGAAATTVVVGPRDTLWGFSKKFGVSETAIRAANKMAPTDNNVRLGQKLIIPAH
jgi:LysM repeat protein